MKLFQLAPDHKEYGDKAGWWMVVSGDLEDELAGPFATRPEAEIAALRSALQAMIDIYWADGDGQLPEPKCIRDARGALAMSLEQRGSGK